MPPWESLLKPAEIDALSAYVVSREKIVPRDPPRINAAAWEPLAMIVMKAGFGRRGVIAAPVFYAYLKSELTSRNLV